ncbi:MAG: hypothetical protein PHI74_02755 [Methanocellales archaeon]|nr:hypothetical protein [Methanocellales archaeon]MDD3291393.1 hypothetical protein [Methanocellales archaeon]MDD5484932.1 hypothetical protein [Methanocellales archaeon]
MKNKTRVTIMYSIALACIALGLLLNHFNLGSSDFQIYDSVGTWLIYVGFIGIIIATVRLLVHKKERVIDERMEFVAAKSLRFVFLCFFILAFAIMIADGIRPITTPYHLFMSYLVCIMLVIYMATYKTLLRFY